jgi:hypothetical protein
MVEVRVTVSNEDLPSVYERLRRFHKRLGEEVADQKPGSANAMPVYLTVGRVVAQLRHHVDFLKGEGK